jgi:hypothetical protein
MQVIKVIGLIIVYLLNLEICIGVVKPSKVNRVLNIRSVSAWPAVLAPRFFCWALVFVT